MRLLPCFTQKNPDAEQDCCFARWAADELALRLRDHFAAV
jgi:hypothetical protein